MDVTVFDLQGRQVGSPARDLTLSAGVHDVPIVATKWAKGFYVLRVVVNGVAATRKFVVIR